MAESCTIYYVSEFIQKFKKLHVVQSYPNSSHLILGRKMSSQILFLSLLYFHYLMICKSIPHRKQRRNIVRQWKDSELDMWSHQIAEWQLPCHYPCSRCHTLVESLECTQFPLWMWRHINKLICCLVEINKSWQKLNFILRNSELDMKLTSFMLNSDQWAGCWNWLLSVMAKTDRPIFVASTVGKDSASLLYCWWHRAVFGCFGDTFICKSHLFRVNAD